jgi:hypothetical protein
LVGTHAALFYLLVARGASQNLRPAATHAGRVGARATNPRGLKTSSVMRKDEYLPSSTTDSQGR